MHRDNVCRAMALLVIVTAGCNEPKPSSGSEGMAGTEDTAEMEPTSSGPGEPASDTFNSTSPTTEGGGVTLGTGTTDEPGTTDEQGTATSTGSTTVEPMPMAGPSGPSKFEATCIADYVNGVEFSIGLTTRECAAEVPEGAPVLQIRLYGYPPVPAGEYPLGEDKAFAYYFDGDMAQFGEVGMLTVVSVTDDGVQGDYDVTLPDNTRLVGEFDAIYCDVEAVCG